MYYPCLCMCLTTSQITLTLPWRRITLHLSHLTSFTLIPVVADPSHAAGRRDLVPALSYAAIAAGADGLIVEVHPNPEMAVSDGDQSLVFDEFDSLMAGLAPFAEAAGRTL